MYFNSTKVLLANCMVIGVTMSICSNNWISMWMGLEISILSFIPFMQTDKISSEESSIKYFIIQSMASAFLLLGIVSMLVGVSMDNETFLLNVSMLIKIGVAPFHNWVLFIVENLKYMVMFTLITIMKIPPLVIISYCTMNMEMSMLLSMTVGALFCLNQTSMRKIIAYSSIFNMGLMLMVIKSNVTWVSYMLIYSTLIFTMMILLKQMKVNFINQMILNKFNPWIKINLWMNMLSMGGMPPLMGFLPKIMTMQMMIKENSLMMMTMMILSSLLVMMFYLRLAFTTMFNFNTMLKWNMQYYKMKFSTLWVNLLMPLVISMKNFS
uniref:NADH-ubiquinone oxidoreductase chain 2 n=1 Tax=Chanohirata hamata TaxID=3032134 RepID=A0A7G8JRX6_9HEMI|nr:NADH dehydrogenase subunit 2 [Chanohirata hamata]QNJ33324.1 NADH dehydrogenase subunit 2 [Chanohirata hamata]